MVDTPWRSVATPDRGGEYLALLSYLPPEGIPQDGHAAAAVRQDTRAARGDSRPHRVLVPREVVEPSLLDPFHLGRRAAPDVLRRERSAPSDDGQAAVIHGRDRVHEVDDPRFRRPALV